MTMQLIYRAQVFEYTPRPIQLCRQRRAVDVNSGEKTIKLIYRALVFEITPPPIQPYQRPRAINWRWQGLLEQRTLQTSKKC